MKSVFGLLVFSFGVHLTIFANIGLAPWDCLGMGIANNQLEDNDPPETRQTLDRLIAAGFTEQQAKEKIAVIIACHIYDIMHDNKEFDREKFVNDLLNIK